MTDETIPCDKRLDLGTRQCHEPSTLFYQSDTTGQLAARCETHNVTAYKPELGRLLVLTREQYLAALPWNVQVVGAVACPTCGAERGRPCENVPVEAVHTNRGCVFDQLSRTA